MKKNVKLFLMFTVTMVMALSATLLASCEKEPETPATPEQPDQPEGFVPLHFEGTLICDGDTFYCQSAEFHDESYIFRDSSLTLDISLSEDRTLLVIFTEVEEDSITYPVRSQTYFFQDGGCCVDYYTPMYGGYSISGLESGSLTLIKLGNSQYRIYGNGRTLDNNRIKFSFEGGLYDRDHPIGQGSLSIGDLSLNLSYAKHIQTKWFHRYIFSGFCNEHIFYITTRDELNELTEDIPFTGDIRDVESGEYACVSISGFDPEVGTVFIEPEGGMLHVTRNGNKISFTLETNSDQGPIKASYEGFYIDYSNPGKLPIKRK